MTETADELSFSNEPDASRAIRCAGEQIVSALDYRDDGRTVAMTRAYTVPTFRGHGYAAEVVAAPSTTSLEAIASSARSAGTSPTGSRRIPSAGRCWRLREGVTDRLAPAAGPVKGLAGRRAAPHSGTTDVRRSHEHRSR
jgi:predicted GNAT family acetyltransferase